MPEFLPLWERRDTLFLRLFLSPCTPFAYVCGKSIFSHHVLEINRSCGVSHQSRTSNAILHLRMFVQSWVSHANIWRLPHTEIYTHTHKDKDVQAQFLAVLLFHKALPKFPFLLIFSKNTRISMGHIKLVNIQVQSKSWSLKTKKHNKLTFCSVMIEVW